MSLATGAVAQSINPSLDRVQSEAQIVGAITIPLGTSTDQRRTAPRFEIISRSLQTDGISSLPIRERENQWQERRIGLTLDGSETLTINGEPLAANEQRDGINTVEGIAIGVGVLLVLGTIAIVDLTNEIESIND